MEIVLVDFINANIVNSQMKHCPCLGYLGYAMIYTSNL